MSDPITKFDVTKAENVNYDSSYYENYNGSAYGRTTEWLGFFDEISKNIIEKLQPKSVLDMGCAYGLLVETLRDRGVEAYGIDISEYAINEARSDLKKFLSVGSILTSVERKYDLVVSIEVIEHIDEADCDLVIQNMCSAADNVLLATTPDDFDDPTHFNVKPPLYWVQKFSKYGFEPDITFDAGFLTPYAVLFRKNYVFKTSSIHHLFGEKKLQDLHFSRITHQKNVQTSQIEDFKRDLEANKITIQSLESIVEDSRQHIENLQESLTIETTARKYYQARVERLQSSWLWKCLFPLRVLNRARMLFIPFFPKTTAVAVGTSVLNCEAGELRGWGSLVVKLAQDENVILKLNAMLDQISERVTAVPVMASGRLRMWIFKKQGNATQYSAEITYGSAQKIQFVRISTAYAALRLLQYRWQIGSGFIAGIKLGLKCASHFMKGSPRGALDEIWPKIEGGDRLYETWLDRYDRPDCNHTILEWIRKLEYKPLISIILPTYNSDLTFLQAAIKSVEMQSYENWQLCIVDDASSDGRLIKYLQELKESPKMCIIFRKNNGHISAASNTAIENASGEFLTFLDHDDELHQHALACVVAELNKNRELDLIYTDEDKIDGWGNRTEPNFKSDWNPDLLLSQNYICHLAVYRASVVKKVGQLREGYEGAQDYDLLLRVTESTQRISHIPLILYHWRAIEGSTALAEDEKDYAHGKAIEALRDCLKRRSVVAEIKPSGLAVYHRVQYVIPTPLPLVSIIVPTRDRADLVKVCVDGLVNTTNYKNWELLIIDNDSKDQKSHEYFRSIESEQIKVKKFEGKFNYSAINNFGVKQSKGQVLLLLNNDIEMIDANWLTELVSHALRPEIGAVGGRLYYSDDHVQHDGIVIGMGGVAGYANPRMNRYDVGSFGGSRLIRNFSAVTAAVLAVRREVFDEVNGLDENNLEVAFNDVDFCLRVAEAGYRNIYTPYCELYHHESISRGADTGGEKALRFEKEINYMKQEWAERIENDPYYNPNLSLKHGFSLDVDRGSKWPWE